MTLHKFVVLIKNEEYDGFDESTNIYTKDDVCIHFGVLCDANAIVLTEDMVRAYKHNIDASIEEYYKAARFDGKDEELNEAFVKAVEVHRKYCQQYLK